MRLFDGERSIDRHFHLMPNTMTAPGDELALHAHKHPHLAIFGPGQWEVDAIVNGEAVTVPVMDYGYAYIRANVKHRVRFLGGAAEGRFVCLFSHYGPTGEWTPDPKATLPGDV